MKILIYSDNHWCQYSSIVRKRGAKYSLRLENQLQSVNWAESLSKILGCEQVVCCGDFFDSSTLNAEEISALQYIQWNENIPHTFLCGNHEMATNDLSFNSMKALELLPFVNVITNPITVKYSNYKILYLPYILEENRKNLIEYITNDNLKLIVFSHNDIKGIQMGKFKSETGFSMKEIENNCDMFINGHLHNGIRFCKNGFNIGNLTGQNFSEDATYYKHCAFVLDTDTLNVEVYENPHAFNFYKIDLTTDSNRYVFNNMTNAVLTVRCYENEVAEIKELLNNNENIIEYRLIVQTSNIKDENVETAELKSVDHLNMFRNYILDTLGNSQTVNEVLSEVTK